MTENRKKFRWLALFLFALALLLLLISLLDGPRLW
jgi:hypothetical protein